MKKLVDRHRKTNSSIATVLGFVRYIAVAAVYFAGGMVIVGAIPVLSSAVRTLLATGGVIAVVAGLAAQEALGSVVSGVMIGYICSAVTELVVTFAQDADIVNLHNWSLGSFSGTTWSSVRAACICVTVIFVLVFLMSKPLSAYQLGESYALNLGVNVRLLRIGMVVFSSILSACVVAFAGPISFVGIAVPQLVKKMLGTAEPIWMIPASFLGGSVFCLFCDLLARTLFAPTELSISTVTAVFGAPVVLWVMAYGKKERVD